MATTRVIQFIIQRRYLFPCTTIQLSKNFLADGGIPMQQQVANYASQKAVTKSYETDRKGGQIGTPLAEVVKENTKSAWYLTVILAGIGVTGTIFYVMFKELFSGNSPNSIYTKTVDKCLNNPKIVDALGSPIKAYGEESRRGRRGHVSHTLYQKDGLKYLRMKFYLQGSRKKGTVHLEMKEDSNGNFVYRYLFIQLQDLLQTVIILEDNRQLENRSFKTPLDLNDNLQLN